METFSASLTICVGNSTVTCEFPAQRPVTRSFVFFDLRLIKRFRKQSWGRWLMALLLWWIDMSWTLCSTVIIALCGIQRGLSDCVITGLDRNFKEIALPQNQTCSGIFKNTRQWSLWISKIRLVALMAVIRTDYYPDTLSLVKSP